MISKTFTFHHPGGIHARPSTQLAKAIKGFDANVFIVRWNERANLKDVLHVLSLGIPPGEVQVEADGPDAEKALEQIEKVFKTDFSEFN